MIGAAQAQFPGHRFELVLRAGRAQRRRALRLDAASARTGRSRRRRLRHRRRRRPPAYRHGLPRDCVTGTTTAPRAAAGSTVFFALAPGIVAGLMPFMVTGFETNGDVSPSARIVRRRTALAAVVADPTRSPACPGRAGRPPRSYRRSSTGPTAACTLRPITSPRGLDRSRRLQIFGGSGAVRLRRPGCARLVALGSPLRAQRDPCPRSRSVPRVRRRAARRSPAWPRRADSRGQSVRPGSASQPAASPELPGRAVGYDAPGHRRRSAIAGQAAGCRRDGSRTRRRTLLAAGR